MLTLDMVVNWFVNERKGYISVFRLQCLAYLAYSYYLITNNFYEDNIQNVLFLEKAIAGVQGPLYPEIIEKYKDYSHFQMLLFEEKYQISESLEGFLKWALSEYNSFSNSELKEYILDREPWLNARAEYNSQVVPEGEKRKNIYIKDEDIILDIL